jgi:RNA-directed DNA polymerase
MTTSDVGGGPLDANTIVDRDSLAKALGVTPQRLRFVLYKVPAAQRYVAFEINKRSGGTRKILAPMQLLKELQSAVAALLETKYKPRSCVYGYVKERNILGNAKRHEGKRWVLRIDLKDFFPSINFGRVRGMLLAKPFEFNEEVATTVAQLCCHENELPQGSPASPTISNIICRGLDHDLLKLAIANKCHYTRYCDDIVFSTQLKLFPKVLAIQRDGKIVVGERLLATIVENGFVVNEEKVHLRSRMQRQIVTGLIVNDRANVPRKLTRELRMVLHLWRKLGSSGVEAWYDDKKNRPPGKERPPFSRIIQGRLQYLGSIRGWDDPVYTRLAGKLADIDKTFSRTQKTLTGGTTAKKLKVYVEGVTDKIHVETALTHFQSKGRFADLSLDLDDKEDGAHNLMSFLEKLNARPQPSPHVFLFDSDIPAITKKVSSPDGGYKRWQRNLYSIVLPTPEHRKYDPVICVELLYSDADLFAKDPQGRRLFRKTEFAVHAGHHISDADIHTTTPKKESLIFDDDVWSRATSRKACISKKEFAELIRGQAGTVDFDGFVRLFEQLTNLRDVIENEVSVDEGAPVYGFEQTAPARSDCCPKKVS